MRNKRCFDTMSLSTHIISALLEIITSKSDWYSKVFNNDIVNTWREEFISQADLYTIEHKTEVEKQRELEARQRHAKKDLILYTLLGNSTILQHNQYFDPDTNTVKFILPTTPVSSHNDSSLLVSVPANDKNDQAAAQSLQTDKYPITHNDYGHPECQFTRNHLELFYNDAFDTALSYLRATAQGTIHFDDCPWEDISSCTKCRQITKDNLANDSDYEGKEITDNDIDYHIYDIDECNHIRCSCIPPHSELTDYISYQKQSDQESRELLAIIEHDISTIPDHDIDWHPELSSTDMKSITVSTNTMVRDIVHPSMYCYVKGISRFNDGSVESEDIEELKYQWLPSEFSIRNNQVLVKSRINNLENSKMVPLIEKIFANFVPRLEKVLNVPLFNSDLQVIVKIGSIHLSKDNPYYDGGSWHLEGQPHEHIAATCISYLKVSGLTDSYLEFRKPTFLNEDYAQYPQWEEGYTRHHFGITDHSEGVMNRYLGLIKCDEGSSVVFPNTLQHHVKPFGLAEGESNATRIILAFFVIDPAHRIISTADIPDQKSYMSLADAKHYRERLMTYRKFYVDSLNAVLFEREFSLCEH